MDGTGVDTGTAVYITVQVEDMDGTFTKVVTGTDIGKVGTTVDTGTDKHVDGTETDGTTTVQVDWTLLRDAISKTGCEFWFLLLDLDMQYACESSTFQRVKQTSGSTTLYDGYSIL